MQDLSIREFLEHIKDVLIGRLSREAKNRQPGAGQLLQRRCLIGSSKTPFPVKHQKAEQWTPIEGRDQKKAGDKVLGVRRQSEAKRSARPGRHHQRLVQIKGLQKMTSSVFCADDLLTNLNDGE